MASNVGGDVFSDVGFFFDQLQLCRVALQRHIRRLEVVSVQYFQYRRKEHDIELCSGLYAGGAW